MMGNAHLVRLFVPDARAALDRLDGQKNCSRCKIRNEPATKTYQGNRQNSEAIAAHRRYRFRRRGPRPPRLPPHATVLSGAETGEVVEPGGLRRSARARRRAMVRDARRRDALRLVLP